MDLDETRDKLEKARAEYQRRLKEVCLSLTAVRTMLNIWV